MALQNQCMKPPPHLFLNKLLKPNTENVWETLPTSLGNLLILQKLVHTKIPVSEVGGGPGNVWKFPAPPPSIYILGGGGYWALIPADTPCWMWYLSPLIASPSRPPSLKSCLQFFPGSFKQFYVDLRDSGIVIGSKATNHCGYPTATGETDHGNMNHFGFGWLWIHRMQSCWWKSHPKVACFLGKNISSKIIRKTQWRIIDWLFEINNSHGDIWGCPVRVGPTPPPHSLFSIFGAESRPTSVRTTHHCHCPCQLTNCDPWRMTRKNSKSNPVVFQCKSDTISG